MLFCTECKKLSYYSYPGWAMSIVIGLNLFLLSIMIYGKYMMGSGDRLNNVILVYTIVIAVCFVSMLRNVLRIRSMKKEQRKSEDTEFN